MVSDCLEKNLEFGVVLAHQGQLFQNGLARGSKILSNVTEDGRLKILTLGKSRFRVKKVLEEKPYLEGEVEFWDDDEPISPGVEALFGQVHQLVREYAKLTGKITDHSLVENYTPYGFSFFLAEINMYSLTRQQEILEMCSAQERLTCGLKSLAHLVQKLKLDQKLQKILGDRHSFFNICN